MPIPIPSNLAINPMVDVRKNDLVTPPAAPSTVESLNAIDPRLALNMPMPVPLSSDRWVNMEYQIPHWVLQGLIEVRVRVPLPSRAGRCPGRTVSRSSTRSNQRT
jgi:hypothetical protein